VSCEHRGEYRGEYRREHRVDILAQHRGGMAPYSLLRNELVRLNYKKQFCANGRAGTLGLLVTLQGQPCVRVVI